MTSTVVVYVPDCGFVIQKITCPFVALKSVSSFAKVPLRLIVAVTSASRTGAPVPSTMVMVTTSVYTPLWVLMR